jgi:hypothetical protein
MIFGIGEEKPPPSEYEFTQRLWIVKPDRLRERLADNLVRV